MVEHLPFESELASSGTISHSPLSSTQHSRETYDSPMPYEVATKRVALFGRKLLKQY